jgi:ubiquinone/menaquinone biosynthesis C-methylase UbiE
MADNAEQIAEWNGAPGRRWAEMRAELDRLTQPFGDAALKAASARPGEKAIDIGCGCGETALALASAVGPAGEVLGVDISQPMLAVAKGRAQGLKQLSFREADASAAALPAGRDLLFSRFGVMFFDAPTEAFAHMRRALASSGRAAFCCWRAPKDNPWAIAPLHAARTAMKVEARPSNPLAPGPFAFSDADRLRSILAGAGFGAIMIERFDAPVRLGANLHEAGENCMRFGPTSRFIREQGEEIIPLVRGPIEASLMPFEGGQGIAPPGSVWIVAAKAQ